MRKICFVKYYDKGSTLMGADQVSEGLRARGLDSRAVYPKDLPGIRDSILIFIKTSKLPDLLGARRRGNRTVLDVQDTVVFKRRIKNLWLFDGLIFKNRRQLEDFGSPGKLCRVLYHQWDPRYRPNEVGLSRFELAYLGDPRSSPEWARRPDIPSFSSDWFQNGLRYNCHLSMREPGRDFLYKPNCKVSTAAACEANLVTTRDESTLELLGPDYPFYCEPNRESLAAAIDHARASFGGPLWKAGLDRMREVRERTSMDRVLDEYVRYCQDLG